MLSPIISFYILHSSLQQFLAEDKGNEGEGTELSRLKESLGGPLESQTEQFWLLLPRSPSHAAAVFTLPVQMSRLQGNIIIIFVLMKSIDLLQSAKS